LAVQVLLPKSLFYKYAVMFSSTNFWSYFYSHFGFFTEDESVENMENRDIYTQDLFGLKSLQNKTKIYTIDGVYHHEWHQNISVIDNCIIPHLD
jgi:hypothetical protein